MKITMIRRFLIGLLILTTTLTTAWAKGQWMSDYHSALDLAKRENKGVLMKFTGSDWCGGCIIMDKKIFGQPEFINYANKKWILLEIDFPLHKRQTTQVKNRNEELSEMYEIEGFPIIVVLNSKGEEVGRIGFIKGGPKAFISKLEKIKLQ